MIVGTRAQVFHGTADHTPGLLTKKDLKMTKDRRIVSKKQSKAGKKNPALKKWRRAVEKAKKALRMPTNQFHPVQGELLRKAREYYNKMMISDSK